MVGLGTERRREREVGKETAGEEKVKGCERNPSRRRPGNRHGDAGSVQETGLTRSSRSICEQPLVAQWSTGCSSLPPSLPRQAKRRSIRSQCSRLGFLSEDNSSLSK